MGDHPLIQPVTDEREYLVALTLQERFREALGDPDRIGQDLALEARQGIIRAYERHLEELTRRLDEYRASTEEPGTEDLPPDPEAVNLVAQSWSHGSQVALRLVELRHDMAQAMGRAQLTSIEIAVLALLYGESKSLQECAKLLHSSPRTIARARDAALEKLRATGAVDAWSDALTADPFRLAPRHAAG